MIQQLIEDMVFQAVYSLHLQILKRAKKSNWGDITLASTADVVPYEATELIIFPKNNRSKFAKVSKRNLGTIVGKNKQTLDSPKPPRLR